MTDYQAYVEQSAAHVLSNHELLMSTPSASRLTSFYPTPSESQNTIAQSVCNSGQLTVQANSKSFGQSSDFIISSPNLLDNPHLRLSFVIPAYNRTVPGFSTQAASLFAGSAHAGWGFDTIDLLEVTFANSNISNLQITGSAMREWSLLQCKNETERIRLLETAGAHFVGSREKEIVMQATVPLSFMFWRTAGGVKGGFPIDGRALNGPIVFRIRFNRLEKFFVPHMSNFVAAGVPDTDYPGTSQLNAPTVANRDGQGHGGVADFCTSVLAFKDLNITFRTYQLMDGAFSVSKALEANPGFVYSIPSLWLNTYNYVVDVNSKGEGSINLNSAPAGMIQAMILTFRPENTVTAAQDASTPDDEGEFGGPGPLAPGGGTAALNYNAGSTRVDCGSAAGFEVMYRPFIPWSLPLDQLKLSYSGQAIFWAQSPEELDEFYENVFQDDLKTPVYGAPINLSVRGQDYRVGHINAAGTVASYSVGQLELSNSPDNAGVHHDTQVLTLPLMHDGNNVFRERGFENLPHYSGSTLQLDFTVKSNNTYRSDGKDRRLTNDATGQQKVLIGTSESNTEIGGIEFPDDVLQPSKPEQVAVSGKQYLSNRTQFVKYFSSASTQSASIIEAGNPTQLGSRAFNFNDSVNGGGGRIRVEITYVIASLFQITNGVAELQL